MYEIHARLQSSNARLSARGLQTVQHHGRCPPLPDDNDFEYVRMLSEGSYGDVHECIHSASGQRVAIKRFKAAHTDMQVWRLALREARVLQTLPHHPHVVRLLRAVCSQASGRLYFVFELMGGCLAQEMARHPGGALPGPLLKTVARQLLTGISHCHEHGVVHRDIKPGNALISRLSPKTRHRNTEHSYPTGDNINSGTVPGRSDPTCKKVRRDFGDTSTYSSRFQIDDSSSSNSSTESVQVKLCDFGFARRVPSAMMPPQTGKVDDHKNSSRQLATSRGTTSGKNASSVAERFICGSFLGRLLLSGPGGSSRNVCVHRRFTADGSRSERDDEDVSGGSNGAAATAAAAAADVGTGGEGQQRPEDDMSSYTVTRWYRPPEILINAPYGMPVDIWSYGCTIAELASGQPLFPGRSSVDQLWRIMRCLGPLPRPLASSTTSELGLAAFEMPPARGRCLAERLPGVDPQLVDLIIACLALDPARRPTAAQLLNMPYFAEPSPQPNLAQVITADEAKRCNTASSSSAFFSRTVQRMAGPLRQSLSQGARGSSCTAVPVVLATTTAVLASSDAAGAATSSAVLAQSRKPTSKSGLGGSAPIVGPKSRLLALTVQTVSSAAQALPSASNSPRQSNVGVCHPRAEPIVSVSGVRQRLSSAVPSALPSASELPHTLLNSSTAGVHLAATHRPLSNLFPSVAGTGSHAPSHAGCSSVSVSGVWDVRSDWLPQMSTTHVITAPVIGKEYGTRSRSSFRYMHGTPDGVGAVASVAVASVVTDSAAGGGGRGGASGTGLPQLLEIVGAGNKHSRYGGGSKCNSVLKSPGPSLQPSSDRLEGNTVLSAVASTAVAPSLYSQPPLIATTGSGALNAVGMQQEPQQKTQQLSQQQLLQSSMQEHPPRVPSSIKSEQQSQQPHHEQESRQDMLLGLLVSRPPSALAGAPESHSTSITVNTARDADPAAMAEANTMPTATPSPGYSKPRKLSSAVSQRSRMDAAVLQRSTVGGYQASNSSSVNGMGIISACGAHLLSGTATENYSGAGGLAPSGAMGRRRSILAASASTGGYGSGGGVNGSTGGYGSDAGGASGEAGGVGVGPSVVMRSAIGAFVEVSRDLQGGFPLLPDTDTASRSRGTGEQNTSEIRIAQYELQYACGIPYHRQAPPVDPSRSQAASASGRALPNGTLTVAAAAAAAVARQARRTVPGAMSYSGGGRDGGRYREDAGCPPPVSVGAQPSSATGIQSRLQLVPSISEVPYGAQELTSGDTRLSENGKRQQQPQAWVGTGPPTPPVSLLLASVALASANGSWTTDPSSTNLQTTGQSARPRAATYSALGTDMALMDSCVTVTVPYNPNAVLHDTGGAVGGPPELLLASTLMLPIPFEADNDDESDESIAASPVVPAPPNVNTAGAYGTTGIGISGVLAAAGTTIAQRTVSSSMADDEQLSAAVPAPASMSDNARGATSLTSGGGRTRFGVGKQKCDELRSGGTIEVEEGKRKGNAAHGIVVTLRRLRQGAKRLKAKALAKFQ